MSIKVGKLADELGVSSENVLEQLHKFYVDAENGDSVVDDKIAALVRIKLGGAKVLEKKKKKEVKPKKLPRTSKKTEEKITEKKKKTEKSKTREKDKKAAPADKKAVIASRKERPVEVVERASESEKPEEVSEEPKADSTSKNTESKNGIRKVQVVEKAEDAKDTSGKNKKKGKSKLGIEVVEKGFKPKFLKKSRKDKNTRTIEIVEKPFKNKKGFRGTKRMGSVNLSQKGSENQETQTAARKTPKKILVYLPVTVRTLAPMINTKPNMILQYLIKKGAVVNINQDLDEDITRDIMQFFGYELELPDTIESIEKELVAEHHDEAGKSNAEPRAPIVTFMGHVDHGKTSLLDYIRKTMVTKGEKGGITQHIGAYRVKTSKGSVTFLDTPGHAAFTAMRARGATVTDVIVLVVAADDGVMPQTKEAIGHARAAEVPIVVAINKCDLAGVNPERVKRELQEEGLAPEAWGGSTIMVEVSAHTGEGVDSLVEMLMLESEMLELKANSSLKARGVVIESKKTPGQGVAVTLLVQNGTLRPGDVVLCGSFYGKVKAMIDDKGERVTEALPSVPVEILGLQGLPQAGDEFFVVKDEKKARTLSLLKQDQTRHRTISKGHRVTLEDLHNQIVQGSIKELKIILKADVQGSLEALKGSFDELSNEEVKLDTILSGIGNINESDAMLAVVSNAIIIGFNVKVDSKAEAVSKSENIDIRKYDVIYEAIAEVKAAMEGLLEPEEREVYQGSAQIREVFASSKVGKVAGCYVNKGVIHRKDKVRVKRGQEIVFDGEIDSLKRFKDDVREVKEGYECGISLKGFNGVMKNDIIEAYTIEKFARRLSE